MFKTAATGHHSSSHRNAPWPPPPVRSHVEGEEFQRDDRQILPAEIGITGARIRPDAVEKPPPRRYSAKELGDRPAFEPHPRAQRRRAFDQAPAVVYRLERLAQAIQKLRNRMTVELAIEPLSQHFT